MERDDETGEAREIKLISNNVSLFESLAEESRRGCYHLRLRVLGDRPDMNSEEQREALSRQLQVAKERLEARQGVDRYDISVEGISWVVLLQPASNATHYSHELIRDLTLLLGEGVVSVREVSDAAEREE